MAKRSCDRHHWMGHFKVGDEWRCSGCGKVERWSEEWSYYGSIGCTKCRIEPAIEFVACSETCRAKLDELHADDTPFADTKRADREAAATRSAIANIDAKIAKLRSRRDELAGGNQA